MYGTQLASFPDVRDGLGTRAIADLDVPTNLGLQARCPGGLDAWGLFCCSKGLTFHSWAGCNEPTAVGRWG